MTRARWHAAAATWLQATGGDESDVDGLAHHLLESAELIGTPMVIPVVLQAARRANRRLAYEHAERLLERAVPLLDTMPRGPERDGLELRLQVQRGALAAARQGWTAPAALDAVRRAYELAGRAEPDREVFLTFYGAMFASIVAGDGARTHDMAESAFDRRNAAGETGRHYELLGRWMRGSVAANRGDLDAAVPDLRRAIELADLDNGQLAEAFFHDPSTVIRGFLGMVLIAGGQVEDGQALAKKSIELAEQSGNPFELSGMSLFLAAGAAVLGDVATAHAAAVRSRALGEQYGFLLYAMAAAQIVGWAEAVAPGARRSDGSAATRWGRHDPSGVGDLHRRRCPDDDHAVLCSPRRCRAGHRTARCRTTGGPGGRRDPYQHPRTAVDTPCSTSNAGAPSPRSERLKAGCRFPAGRLLAPSNQLPTSGDSEKPREIMIQSGQLPRRRQQRRPYRPVRRAAARPRTQPLGG